MGSIFIPVSILLLASVVDRGLILHKIIQIIIKPNIAIESYRMLLYYFTQRLCLQHSSIIWSYLRKLKSKLSLDWTSISVISSKKQGNNVSYCVISNQGCALVEPSGPWCLTFVLGRLENLSFFIEIICWAPGFHKFRALGSLQFFLEHSLGNLHRSIINKPIQGMLNLAPFWNEFLPCIEHPSSG